MPRSESYLASRGYTIDIERNRLSGLRDRARAAQSRCKRDEDRDCLQAEIDVWSGILGLLERAASGPAPDAPVLSAQGAAFLAAAERRVG